VKRAPKYQFGFFRGKGSETLKPVSLSLSLSLSLNYLDVRLSTDQLTDCGKGFTFTSEIQNN
jgi:hypothetical protein